MAVTSDIKKKDIHFMDIDLRHRMIHLYGETELGNCSPQSYALSSPIDQAINLLIRLILLAIKTDGDYA